MSAHRVEWPIVGWGLTRWVLAGVFLYAGFVKLLDPAALAASIARFQLVPEFLIHPMALALPPLEILCGIALLAGPWKRKAALGISLLCVLFLGALFTAAARGIAVECSCFGGSAGEPIWRLITRDVVLLGVALIVYLRLLCAKQNTEVSPLSLVDDFCSGSAHSPNRAD